MARNEVLTRDVLESILDKKLKPLSTKIDSVIESIDFMEAKVSDLHKSINDVEYTTDHVLKETRLLIWKGSIYSTLLMGRREKSTNWSNTFGGNASKSLISP